MYQRGEDGEGVLGFLVDDIKQEIRRSARLVGLLWRRRLSRRLNPPVAGASLQTCCACKKKGACVGCYVKSCRKTVHFPCGRRSGFVSQFAQNFP